ncbi:MAG: alpha/beta fold hydrolase [Wenzhouxiangella sp.]|nr:MAG: alpha/beta fold hydrolase [Wenzhouxiangella sp.]
MPHQQPVVPVATSDDHRFDLIHVPAGQARHSLLFLPGMGLSARQYIPFAQALAGRGVETYIHEWRGIGSSSLRASRAVDWGYRELLAADLQAALTELATHATHPQLLIGGHSLGSQLACLLAAMRPQACSGLLIVAGGAPYWRAYSGWMRWALPAIFFGMPAISAAAGHYPGRSLGFAGRESRGVIRDWAASGRSGVYAPGALSDDLEAGLARLECPTLALRMADDWFVPQSSLDWLAGKLARAPVVQGVVRREGLSGPADHYRWMREPETTVTAVFDWLGSREKTGQSEAASAAATRRA